MMLIIESKYNTGIKKSKYFQNDSNNFYTVYIIQIPLQIKMYLRINYIKIQLFKTDEDVPIRFIIL